MNESKGGGLGLPTILFAVFLILKLTGAIDWSWWAVTAPLWVSIALAIVWGIGVGVVVGVRNSRERNNR